MPPAAYHPPDQSDLISAVSAKIIREATIPEYANVFPHTFDQAMIAVRSHIADIISKRMSAALLA